MTDGVLVPIFQLTYDALYAVATMLWGINQALLMVAYYLMALTAWLMSAMFAPMIQMVSDQTGAILPLVFTTAFLLMAITYALSIFGVGRIVELKSALMWFVVAAFLFNFGPALYLGLDGLRRSVGAGFYQAVFQQMQAGANTIEGLDYIQNADSGDLQVAPLHNNYQLFLPTYDVAIDGTDAAMAYLNSDGCDVLRAPGCILIGELPLNWYTPGSGLFDNTQSSVFFPTMTADERQASLQQAMTGLWILFSGITLSFFAMLEAVINLCLTIAFAFGFISLFIAILFAFFKRTEAITHAAIDIIIGLFIQSIITSLLLALVMAFVIIAAGTGNGFLLFGVSFIGIILLVILLIGAVQAILQAVNGLVKAFASATGGNLGAAGTITGVTGAALTGGTALAATGSLTQAAGATLGPRVGQQAYYASRVFGETSTMGQAAQDVATGGFASVLGPVGSLALGQTDANLKHLPAFADAAAAGQRVMRALGTPIHVDIPADQSPTPDPTPGVTVAETPLPPTVADTDDAPSIDYAQARTPDPVAQPITVPRRLPAPLAARPVGAVAGTTADGQRGWVDWTGRDRGQPPVPMGDVMDYNRQPHRNADGSPMISYDAGGLPQLDIHDMTRVRPLPVTAAGSAPYNGARYRLRMTDAGTTELERVMPTSPANDRPSPITTSDSRVMASTRAGESIRVLKGIGTVTEQKLNRARIQTVGDLAQAEVEDLTALDGFSPSRANYMIRNAHQHLGQTDSTANETQADAIAARVDAADDDDNARLATQLATSVQRALVQTGGAVIGRADARHIAQTQGLGATPASGDFLRAASVLQIPPAQAAQVVQEVASTGNIGAQLASSLQAGLAQITLPNGTQLDSAGIQQAVQGLERAAQALVAHAPQNKASSEPTAEMVQADLQAQQQSALGGDA